MGEAVARLLSPDEYLAWERAQATKHEYVDGAVIAMAGASADHNTIVANLLRALGNALGDKACRALASDMRIKIPATGRYRYADASVACDPLKFEDDARDTLLNPVVIVEVLSDSTEREDRGQKFRDYRSIPSLREYVLVAQDMVIVERYVRSESGRWTMQESFAGQTIELSSCGVEIRVEDVYSRVLPQSGVRS